MTFGAMGTGLTFHGFSELPGGTPELRQCTSGTLNDLLLEAVEDRLSSLNP